MNEPPTEFVPPVGPESLAIDVDPAGGTRPVVDRGVPPAFRALLHSRVRCVRDDERHDADPHTGPDGVGPAGDEELVSGQYGPTADYGNGAPDQQSAEEPAGRFCRTG